MKTHLVYLSIIVVLVFVLGVALGRPAKEVEVVRHTTDTLTVVKYDTVRKTEVKWKDRQVIDTVYIASGENGQAPVPISKYNFTQPDLFDIHATGYDVKLTDVTVFPKTEYRTITNTVEKEILTYRWDCYLGAGISAFDRRVIPSINFYVKAPRSWLFGVNVGYYNGGCIYGANISYKLNK